jgi:hypothetical protein
MQNSPDLKGVLKLILYVSKTYLGPTPKNAKNNGIVTHGQLLFHNEKFRGSQGITIGRFGKAARPWLMQLLVRHYR